LRARLRKFLAAHSKPALLTFFIGLAIVIMLVFMAIFAPLISPYNPIKGVSEPMESPNGNHPWGTDTLGRDVLSRTIWGGRASIMVALIAMLVSLGVGSPLGAISGYLGGKLDRVFVIAMDTFYAFPTHIMALMIAIMLSPEAMNIAIAVGAAHMPRYFRVVRSISLSIRERLFIEAEKSLGASSSFIILHHILPYTISSITVLMSLGIAHSILTVAGLGFLGIGVQPPTPEWGTDMRWGRDIFLIGKWWAVVYPGFMIFLTVMGFNLLSEGLNAIFQERGGGRYAT